MTLKERINNDIKEAMKAKDMTRLGTLRMLISVIKNEEINSRAKGGSEILSDEEVMKILRRENKKREESVKVYTDGGRPELAEGEKKEMEVISSYLPQDMGADEIKAIVKKVIDGGAKNIGDVMKAVMAETGGRAPGKIVSEIAKEILG